MDPQALGRRLREVRELRGLEQQDVARGSGLSQPQISRLERGLVQHPNVFDVLRLADFYHYSIEALAGVDRLPADEAARIRQEARSAALREAAALLERLAPAPTNTDEHPDALPNGKESSHYIYPENATPPVHRKLSLTAR